MTRSWKYMVVVLTLLFPAAVKAQERVRPDTASVAKYPPGSFAPLGIGELVRRVGMPVLLDSSTVIEAMGMADSLMFSSACENSNNPKLCNEDHNIVLAALKRTSAVADTFELIGVSRQRIKWLPPKICKTENEDCRGVFFYINNRLVTPDSRPEDFTAQRNPLESRVAGLEGRMTAKEKADSTRDTKLAEHDREIAAGNQMDREQNIRLGNIESQLRSRPARSTIADVELSAGAYGLKAGDADAFGGTASVSVFPTGGRLGLIVRVGYWNLGTGPINATDSCNRHDVMWGADVNYRINQFLSGSVGAHTTREACGSGKSKVAEKWLTRINGLKAGPTFHLPIGKKVEAYLGLSGTWSQLDYAATDKTSKHPWGWAVMSGATYTWRW